MYARVKSSIFDFYDNRVLDEYILSSHCFNHSCSSLAICSGDVNPFKKEKKTKEEKHSFWLVK